MRWDPGNEPFTNHFTKSYLQLQCLLSLSVLGMSCFLWDCLIFHFFQISMNVYLLPVCLVPHVMMTLMDITAHAQMDIQEYIVKQVSHATEIYTVLNNINKGFIK